MSFNSYALGVLAGERIRQFFREMERDRLAKEATQTRAGERIGSDMHLSAGPRPATPWMIAARALLGFASLIGREATRVRSTWGD